MPPMPISPRAYSTASRAIVPVPQGERSSRPGAMTTALLRTSSGPRGGPPNSVKVTVPMSGWSGCVTGVCSAAAPVMR